MGRAADDREWEAQRERVAALRLGAGLWLLAYGMQLFALVAWELWYVSRAHPFKWSFIPYWLNAPAIEKGASQVTHFLQAPVPIEILIALLFISACLFAISCALLGSVRRNDQAAWPGRTLLFAGLTLLGVSIVAHVLVNIMGSARGVNFMVRAYSVLALLEGMLGLLAAFHLRKLFRKVADPWLSKPLGPLLYSAATVVAARAIDIGLHAGEAALVINYILKAAYVATGLGFVLVMMRLWTQPPERLEP